MRGKKYNLIELQEYRKTWVSVQTEYMEESMREVFERRKMAVDLYIDGISVKQIHASTKVSPSNLIRLISRCIEIDPITSIQYGYCALIPNKKLSACLEVKQKNTTAKSKGAFSNLLVRFPDLEIFIKDTYFGNKDYTLEKRITPANMHKKFLEECKRYQIQSYEYPFNTEDYARRTFYKYLRHLDSSEFAIKRESKEAQRKYNSTGFGERRRPYPLAPFSVVQLDGHKIDLLYTVEVKNKHGEVFRKPATRVWIIAVIDVATRAILGYSICPNENYDQTDILRAIRNAIIPRKPMEFSLSDLQYPADYGFHSLMMPETEWAMPEIIMLDNAKAHLANRVLDKLTTQLYCSLNFGSVATPETRGTIERWFKTMEENGYHRLPSTTGSNVNDVKRRYAEENSIKYEISYDDIVQITEYLIALYNTSAHSALDYESPLGCMKRRINEAGMQPSIVNSEMKKKIYELTNIVDKRVICGNPSKGRRPYITYEGVEYRNDILSSSTGLIGKELIITVNPDDISIIRGYFPDGKELGLLKAVGEWGMKRHSLKTRKDARRLAAENKKKSKPFYAPLEELEKEFESRAETARRARTKAARIRNEQKLPMDSLKKQDRDGKTMNGDIKSIHESDKKWEEDAAIRKKREKYTPEQLEAILKSGSLEEAFKKGLI